MAHLVTRIDDAGPAWSLSFPDVDDGTAIQDVLVAAGLIELYDGAPRFAALATGWVFGRIA